MKTTIRLLIALLALGTLYSLYASSGKSNVGTQVPDLKQLEYVQNAVDPAGKPMILEFWATWCGPCRTSIPHLNQIYKKYKDRGLVAVGVTKEEKTVVQAFLKNFEMSYAVAINADGSLGKGFGIRGIPHAMLVDKSGKIIWEGHPMELENSRIEKLLKQ